MAREATNDPRSIGRYEIVGRLAKGGMAEILLGRFTGPSGFERAVAIKRILPGLATEKSFVNMFLDEARLAARIKHPNVVQYTELGEEGGQLFLVMEYLEGESLASLMRRSRSRRVPIGRSYACHLIAEAAAGLHAAHAMEDKQGLSLGVVHRDISPQNIFVSYDGSVKVMDFGIAKAADRITETETGGLKGKVEYMSPEQAGGGELDPRSDIFSLGVVLYELTTGRRLFRRATPLASLRAVRDVVVPPPRSLDESYPPDLEDVVLKALASQPEDRYASAQDMRRDLLAVSQRLQEGELPEVGIKAVMTELFRDRIRQKREMLHNVTTGNRVTTVPVPEVDIDIELPTAIDEVTSVDERAPVDASTPMPTPTPPTVVASTVPPSTRRTRWVIPLLGAIMFVGVAALYWGQTEASAPSTPLDTADSPPVATPDPAPAESVTLAIQSVPGGAAVFIDDRLMGTTPTEIRLPASDALSTLRLELEGYLPLETEVTPDATQRLSLSLRAEPESAGR